MRHVRLATALVLYVWSIGCGGSTSPAPLPAVGGRWQGTIASPADGAGTIVLNLDQSGATVTGTVVLSQAGLPDAAGTFSGTFATTSGATTLNYTTFYDYGDGCTGTYNGSLKVSDGVLSGTYVGKNCAHDFTGDLRATRVP